jgi:16S rRNA (guanine527-N7)-methyltransferase
MSPAGAGADDLSAVQTVLPVSRETGDRLAAYVALIRKWNKADNLVGPSTLPEIWRRHIADSAQLVALFPESQRWLDLGSGAGLPGIVIAVLLAGKPDAAVHLVESNRRKCAFLRQAIRATGAPATVHEGRVEAVVADWDAPVDRISARAFAPLGRLLELASPLMERGVPGAFHKGQDFVREISEVPQSWGYDLVKHESRLGGGGVILEVRNLHRRAADSQQAVDRSP